MRKHFSLTIPIFALILALPISSLAQGVTDGDGHTAREEAEGEAIWEKLQAKDLNCEDLSANSFGSLGEYFMGQMAGDSHEAMNKMMTQMMGDEGEKKMHVAMGKRLSGCDTSAAIPTSGIGFMPMIQLMMGGGDTSMMGNFGNNPMGWFGGVSLLGLLTWLLLLAFLILGSLYFWERLKRKK